MIIVRLYITILMLALCPVVFARGSQEKSAPTTADAPVRDSASLDVLYAIQDTFESVAAEVLPVVVEINTVATVRRNIPRNISPWDFFFGRRPNNNNDNREQEFRLPGLGSGVLVRNDGRTHYVLTNNHVVGEADEIVVNLYDGREFDAEVVGKDERFDLALISFQSNEDIPLARLGDSNNLRVGHWVIAVGNPLGFDSTVTAGIVSAVHREAGTQRNISAFTDYIQTDAAINRGNSGGALVNLNGEIVGINTWIASGSGGSIGLGFAIPINNAKEIIDDFIREGSVVYGWLGVYLYDINNPNDPLDVASDLGLEEERGALITNVYRNAPATRDGLRPGDFISHIDDTKIDGGRTQVARIIGQTNPDVQLPVTIVRNNRSESFTISLGRRPADDQNDDSQLWPGLIVSSLTEQIREQQQIDDGIEGIIIAGVIENTPAERNAQLQQGDIITEINGNRVRGVDDFYRSINNAGTRNIPIQIMRGEEQLTQRLPRL